MVAFQEPSNNQEGGDRSKPKPDIEGNIERRLAEIHATSRVTCAVIDISADQVTVNNKPFNIGDKHEIDLPLVNARGSFQIQREGDGFVLSFESAETGIIKESLPSKQTVLAVYLGNRFYIAPEAVRLTFKDDGSLWNGKFPVQENVPINLGVGELFATKHDGLWIFDWKHPDCAPDEFPDSRTRSILHLSGEYELTYCFGRLMTFSHALVEVADSEFSIDGRVVEINQKIPFHLDGDGRLWLATDEDAIFVCYSSSISFDRKKLCDLNVPGKFDVSYNSGPEIEITPLD